MPESSWLFLFAFVGALGGLATIAQFFLSVRTMAKPTVPDIGVKTVTQATGIQGWRLAFITMFFILSGGLSLWGFLSVANRSRGPIAKGWGAPPGTRSCLVIADGSQLFKWSGKYNLAFACGFNDGSIDRFEDERISVSNPFTIINGDISMAMDYSLVMKQLEDNMMEQAKRGLPKSTPKGTVFAVQEVVGTNYYCYQRGPGQRIFTVCPMLDDTVGMYLAKLTHKFESSLLVVTYARLDDFRDGYDLGLVADVEIQDHVHHFVGLIRLLAH